MLMWCACSTLAQEKVMLLITPNGKFLLCCCRDSDVIQVFQRDMQTGMLTNTNQDINASKVVCAQFTSFQK